MKHDLRGSLLAKVVAIFLVVLLGLAALYSVGGLAIAYEAGFYREESQTFEDTELFQDAAESIAFEVAAGYLRYGDPYSYVLGIQVEIRDADTGETLYSDWTEPYQQAVTYTFPVSEFGVSQEPVTSEGETSTEDTLPPAPAEHLAVTVYFSDYADVSGFDLASSYVFYQLVYPVRDSLPWLAIFSVISFFAVLVFLLCAAGHRRGSDEIVPNWLDRVPLDLLLVIFFCLGSLNVFVVAELNAGGWIQLALIVALCIPLCLLVLAALMTLSTRLKLGKFWENTICWKLGTLAIRFCRTLWHGVGTLVHILPLTWRWVLVAIVLLILQPLLAIWGNYDGGPLLLLFLLDGALLVGTAFFSWQLQKCQAEGQALADGNLEAKIDTRHMFWDIKTHAENLNAIGDGMNRAVEQRMKSERLKTELITNVSHDIKTPLTSIVNYVDLLKKEELSGTAAEYLAVLDRQSNRLKKLTEDLVEASKASTGNIAVSLQPLVVNEIILQAVGEYDQKLTAGKLEVIINTFEGNLSVLADSRLLWRVLDNLLSNVCKYAMAGSRVYIDLGRRENRVALSMKNISRDQLNISADELMERFVRGDSSRHAEGSGLGLNIAKSLMELMGGTFSIAVDGDLFKAELTLPEA